MDKQFLILSGLLASGTFGGTMLATTPETGMEASRAAALGQPHSAPAGPSVYYRRCADARAVGAAPIRIGEPGYRDQLDADGDGIACEPYRGR